MSIIFKKNTFQKILIGSLVVSAISGSAFLIFPIGGFHIFPFRIIFVLCWIMVILSILVRKGKLNITHIKVKHYLFFLLAWLCYAIITLIWVPSKTLALKEITFLLIGVSIVSFLVYFLNSIKDLKTIYILWIIMLLLLIGIAFWEHLTGYHLQGSKFFQTPRTQLQFRPTAVFRNSNDFATFLVLTSSFLINIIRYAKRKIYKILAGGLFGTSFYFIIITGSRANILAIALIIFVLFFFFSNFSKKIKIIFATLLILSTIFLLFPNFIQTIYTRLSSEMVSLSSSYQWTKGSIINRIGLAKNALYYLRESYGFGVGTGNIEWHINDFAPYWTRPGLLNLHNWWLEILSEYGIFIFTGYVLMYLSLVKNLWKIWRKKLSYIEKMLCEALLLSLIGFLIASISSSSIMGFKPQWLLFGFALAFLNYYRNTHQTIKK